MDDELMTQQFAEIRAAWAEFFAKLRSVDDQRKLLITVSRPELALKLCQVAAAHHDALTVEEIATIEAAAYRLTNG